MRLTLIFALLASLTAILDARTIAVMQNDVTGADAGGNKSTVKSTTDHMTMSFMMGKTPVRLELDKNDNIPQLYSYYTFENGTLIQWPADKGQELYAFVNRTTQDTIVMSRHRQDGSIVKGYMGSFNVGGQRYSLMTMDALKALHCDGGRRKPLPMTSNTSTVYLDNLLHVIQPVLQNETEILDDAVLSANTSAVNEVVDADDTGSQQRRNAAAGGPYVIDYFVVVDYAIYYRWYSTSTASSHRQRRQDAVRNIRYYYSHVVNGIDLRYSTIREQHPDFAINVRFVGFLIAMSPSESVWTERSDLKMTWSGKPYTDAYKSLDVLGEFIEHEQYRDVFETVDHVALFTGNNLYNGQPPADGKGPLVISGLAWIASACKGKQRTSVNKEFGQYASITTGAHELGHNVGAYHDGHMNECSNDNQFIMATSPQYLSESNFDNAFRFSHCSIRSFRWYISRLNTEPRNCLSERSNLPTVIDNSRFPGQQYSADEQ